LQKKPSKRENEMIFQAKKQMNKEPAARPIFYPHLLFLIEIRYCKNNQPKGKMKKSYSVNR
jgi:hypothetical protein